MPNGFSGPATGACDDPRERRIEAAIKTIKIDGSQFEFTGIFDCQLAVSLDVSAPFTVCRRRRRLQVGTTTMFEGMPANAFDWSVLKVNAPCAGSESLHALIPYLRSMNARRSCRGTSSMDGNPARVMPGSRYRNAAFARAPDRESTDAIENQSHDPSLSAITVAQRLVARYLALRASADAGHSRSFAGHVLLRRLAIAATMLRDPSFQARKIAEDKRSSQASSTCPISAVRSTASAAGRALNQIT